MATSGFTFGGLTLIGSWFTTNATQLVCYTNAQNSLGDTTVASDLLQPSQTNGYAPITLAAANWINTNGILTYSTGTGTFSNNPTWQATGAWSNTVNGVAIIYSTSCVAFKDLSTPWTAANGLKLSIDLLTVL